MRPLHWNAGSHIVIVGKALRFGTRVVRHSKPRRCSGLGVTLSIVNRYRYRISGSTFFAHQVLPRAGLLTEDVNVVLS